MVDQAQSGSPSQSSGGGAVRRWLDGVFGGFFALRVPLVMGLLTVAVLIIPDQVREIHRILTQDRSQWFLDTHWLLALLALVTLSLVLWQTSRQHAEDFLLTSPGDEPIQSSARWLLTWGPRLIATLPLIGAAIGIWLSHSTTVRLEEDEFALVPDSLKTILLQQGKLLTEFVTGSLICVALAVIVFVVATLFERKLAPVGSQRVRRVAIVNNWLLFPLFILGSIGLLIYNPVRLPQWLGSIPIFALWMANLAVLFALFWRYSRLIGIPILAVLAALLIIFEFSGATDNHRFRYEAAPNGVGRPAAPDAYRTWIASRADLAAYKAAGKAYPVYIVATEGGGLFAAYQTAKLLGRLQDLCGNFAQHTFMMSGVSGGSLGSAVFAGLAQEHAKNEPTKPCGSAASVSFEKVAEDILSRDLLSPVIWGTLFPDFLQRFIPYPFPQLDRGYTLELAFENMWADSRIAPKKNYLHDSFFKLCGDDAVGCTNGATPALALNVTNVETGMQMVLSQVEFNTWPFEETAPLKPIDFFNNVDSVNMTTSTAVGLSARFPWISPQGWYTFKGPDDTTQRRMSFVDGGYVDNSGVATALKVARLLTYLTKNDTTLPAIEVKLIVISAAWIPVERFWIDDPQNRSLSEYVSPLVAALAAWQGRGFTAQYEAEKDKVFPVIDLGVYYNFMPLPVGWHLSKLSRQYIDQFRGDPANCDEQKAKPWAKSHATMAGAYIFKANCAAAQIVKDLNPATK